jgi:hypothetical protein
VVAGIYEIRKQHEDKMKKKEVSEWQKLFNPQELPGEILGYRPGGTRVLSIREYRRCSEEQKQELLLWDGIAWIKRSHLVGYDPNLDRRTYCTYHGKDWPPVKSKNKKLPTVVDKMMEEMEPTMNQEKHGSAFNVSVVNTGNVWKVRIPLLGELDGGPFYFSYDCRCQVEASLIAREAQKELIRISELIRAEGKAEGIEEGERCNRCKKCGKFK